MLPKEEEWEQYLKEQMPLYKQSAKKPDQREFPFDIMQKPYPRLLQHAYIIFESLQIEEYSKLEYQHGFKLIDGFK